MKNVLCFTALVGYFIFLNNQLFAHSNNLSETEGSDTFDSVILKTLSGGDTQYFRHPYKDPFAAGLRFQAFLLPSYTGLFHKMQNPRKKIRGPAFEYEDSILI